MALIEKGWILLAGSNSLSQLFKEASLINNLHCVSTSINKC